MPQRPYDESLMRKAFDVARRSREGGITHLVQFSPTMMRMFYWNSALATVQKVATARPTRSGFSPRAPAKPMIWIFLPNARSTHPRSHAPCAQARSIGQA